MSNLQTNCRYFFLLVPILAISCIVSFAQQQTYTYAYNTDQGFPPSCGETINYDCVDIVFEQGCGCWGGYYPGAIEFSFGGIMAFYLNVSNDILSIEVDQNDYCGGTCTFFRVFNVEGDMIYEDFGSGIDNPFVNVDNHQIGYYQYGSCEAGLVSTTINYSIPVVCECISVITLSGTIPSGTYSATEDIIASGEVIGDVIFEAGSSISLQHNFSVSNPASFQAKIGLIEGCN